MTRQRGRTPSVGDAPARERSHGRREALYVLDGLPETRPHCAQHVTVGFADLVLGPHAVVELVLSPAAFEGRPPRRSSRRWCATNLETTMTGVG